MQASDPCGQCPHQFGGHVMVATTDNDPLKGGITLCPHSGCQCFSTWAPSHPELPPIGRDDITIPDRLEIEALREAIQGEAIP